MCYLYHAATCPICLPRPCLLPLPLYTDPTYCVLCSEHYFTNRLPFTGGDGEDYTGQAPYPPQTAVCSLPYPLMPRKPWEEEGERKISYYPLLPAMAFFPEKTGGEEEEAGGEEWSPNHAPSFHACHLYYPTPCCHAYLTPIWCACIYCGS